MSRRAGLPLLLIAALVAAVVTWRLPESTAAATLVDDVPSARVAERLRHDFGDPMARTLVLLVDGLPVPAASDSGRALVRHLVDGIARQPGVSGIISPAGSLDTLLLGDDGRSAIVVVGLAPAAAAPTIARLRAAASGRIDGARLSWTGEPLVVDDVRRLTRDAVHDAERLALPLTLVAASIVFGGIVPGVVAVAVAGVALLIATAGVRLLELVLPLGTMAIPVATLIALALALDYALWRRRGGMTARDVGVAAIVACCALLALLFAPGAELRGAAIAGVVAIGAAWLVTSLAAIGEDAVAPPRAAASSLASAVVHRPLLALAVTLVPLGILAVRAIGAPAPADPLAWLPASLPSLTTVTRLEAVGRGAASAPILVLVDLPAHEKVFDAGGWRRMQQVDSMVRATSGIVDTRSVLGVGTGERTVTADVVPASVLASFVSRDHRSAVIRAFIDGRRSLDDARAVAATLAGRFAGDSSVTIGGAPRMLDEYRAALRSALPRFALLAALGCWLALAIVFRAPIVAAKAVGLNLLVAAGAIGLVTFLPTVRAQGLPATVPLVALGTAFALSIDYELLLLLQVRRVGTDARAIALGSSRASDLFLRGGVLLLVVILAFAIDPFLPLGLLGMVLAATIAIDVLVVRPIVAPALLAVLGVWNWWPGVDTSGRRLVRRRPSQ